jgi:hypothetical protein
MQQDLAWAAANPDVEDDFFNLQSDTAAYSGHRREAFTLSRRAAEVARRKDENETAAVYVANAALREAEFGNSARAVEMADSALKLASSRDVSILAALALARAGSPQRAQTLSAELARNNPSNTILNLAAHDSRSHGAWSEPPRPGHRDIAECQRLRTRWAGSLGASHALSGLSPRPGVVAS